MLGLFDKRGIRKYWKEVIETYDDLAFTKTIKNTSSLCRKVESQQGRISVDFCGSYNGDNVVFYYLIQNLPNELSISFKDNIRRECRPGVRVNFYNHLKGHRIDWNSAQMKSRLRVLQQVGDDNDRSNINAYNLHKNITSLGKQDRVEESLAYLAVADQKRGRNLLKSSILMTVNGKRSDNFDDSIKQVEEYCKHIGITLVRVLYDVPDVLRYFSPFSRRDGKVKPTIPTHVLTDELLARFNVYNQGTLGVRGITFGTDVYSNFPVLKVVKPKDDSAENWIVTAETGGGKSYMIKDILLQLLARGFNGTIMDIEGFEYQPIANYTSHHSNVIVINMAEGSGKYFDSVEIADETGIDDIDKDRKSMSFNFTLATFKTILFRAKDDLWVDNVVNDAVSEVYLRAGVTDDPETWSNSKGLTFFDVYRMFRTLKEENYRDNDNYREALDIAISTSDRYFKEGGTRASIFKERILVSDIVDADLVVCSFGMAGKAESAVDEIQLALMQLGAAQISHQRSIYSKAQGKFNFKVWEEFQRWGKFPNSEKTIGVAVTGGRKLGDVNIIITNDVGQILDNDRFSIFSNITSFLVGAISDEQVRHELCRRLSVPNMIPEIDAIAKAKKDENEEEEEDVELNPLTYSFLCGLDKSKYGIVKVALPRELQKSGLFKTGVKQKKKKVSA